MKNQMLEVLTFKDFGEKVNISYSSFGENIIFSENP